MPAVQAMGLRRARLSTAECVERRESVSDVVEGGECVRSLMREAMAARGIVRVGVVWRRCV